MSRWIKWIAAPALLIAALACVNSANKVEAHPYGYGYRSYYPSYGVRVHYGYRPAYPVYHRSYYPHAYPIYGHSYGHFCW